MGEIMISDYFKYLECIKCGSKENLNSYMIFASEQRSIWFSNRVHVTTVGIEVPTCHNCITEFNNWKNKDSLLLRAVLVCLCCLSVPCLYLVIAYVWSNISGSGYVGVPIVVFSVVILTLTSLIGSKNIIHNKKDSNPNKYVKLAHHGIKYVKPQKKGGWIRYEDWIQNKMKEVIETQYRSS